MFFLTYDPQYSYNIIREKGFNNKGRRSMSKAILRKTGIVSLVILMLISAVLLIGGEAAFAYEEKSATIKYDIVNIRANPTTSSSIVSKLALGKELKIIDETDVSDGYIWYKVKYTVSGTQKQGWVRSDCITIAEDIPTDAEFEAYLTEQGFPESYKIELRKLHDKYPNWVFVAQHTGLEWDDVIAAESRLGVSLVHTSSISSWKSVQTGAYDWTTGTWNGLDSSEWVAASPEIIRYYMDPRNFLDDSYIFQFVKQSYDTSSQDYEKNLTDMVKNTFLSGSFKENGQTKTYVSAILEAAESSGVSPYTIATMIIQEQGVNGTGGSISGTEPGYEGYYNFFNVAAYAANGLTPVQKGLQYAKVENGSYGRPWNTRTKSIAGGAQYFGEGYIKKGQDTIYLKKFNVQGSNLYGHQYMTNIQGAASEGKILSKAYSTEARKTALEFKIPVYKNMPNEACKKPTGDGSPNYMLQSLSVSGQSLTPTFSMYDTEYSVIVPNEISSVTVSAKAYDSNAKISGAGRISLNTGRNAVKIKVTAQSGGTRTYTITIIRNEATTTKPITSVTSTQYKLNDSEKTITGIKTFPITASEFEKGLTVKNGSVKILKTDGSRQTGNVGTGNVVKVYDTEGTVKTSYNIIIYGDANGDGKVNAQDLLTIQKNNIKVSLLSGVKRTAADVNRDGKVNAQDLLLVQKNNIKVKPIEQ